MLKRQVTSVEEEEKRKRRLARNRESARECRKRKKAKQIALRQQIAHLEADNLQLRLKLQNESDPTNCDQECADITSRLSAMINDGVADAVIQQELAMYQQKYSDYGRDRRSAIEFHLSQLRKSLLPTQTTLAFIWIVNSSVELQEAASKQQVSQSRQHILELWLSLIDELKISMEQLQQFASLLSSDRRFLELNSASQSCDRMIDRLAYLVSNKNESLDQEMAEVQRILSATQIAKFILWIDRNPACMQMLEALWPHLGTNKSSRDVSDGEEETEG